MMDTFYLLCREYGFYPRLEEKEIEITALLAGKAGMAIMNVDLADYKDIPIEDMEIEYELQLNLPK
ncbi:MAG: hypothetical protein L0Y56_06050 [Nitrospira sp.]|nr:hypothetical protein [Nitrospira sp.]